MGGAFSSNSNNSNATNAAKNKKAAAAASISNVDRAMLDLKNARDRLSKYKKKLEQDESKLTVRAKECKLKGDTKTALNLLKLRKMKLNEVDNVEGQLLNVMQLVQTIDSKQNEAEVLQAMKVGKDTLQAMHEEITVDDVIELMDQVAEQHEMEREISSILEGVPGTLSVADEAAIEAELEALMLGSGSGEALPEMPAVPTEKPLDLPVAPTTDIQEPATTEAAEPEQRVAVAS